MLLLRPPFACPPLQGHWPPERMAVTLIVGLRCTDGVVLAADTEESTAYTRGRTRKLLTRTFANDAVVAIAGAGSGDLIDSAVEQIFEMVDTSKPKNIADLKALIRQALLRFYRQEVRNYPTRDPLDTVVDLICAIRAPAPDKHFALYKASGPVISSVSGFAVLGSGAVMRHVLEELYQPTIAVQRGVALVLHLLSLGKRYVTGVGGDSHIVTLTADGMPVQEPIGEIRIKERYLDGFNRLVGELLLHFPDRSIMPRSFTEAMERLTTDAGSLREKQITELGEVISQNPTDGVSPPTGQPVTVQSETPSAPPANGSGVKPSTGRKPKVGRPTPRVRRGSRRDR